MRRMVEGNGTTIILYRLDPGSKFDLHTHEFSELGVLLSGEGYFLLEDERRLVRGGDSFFIPPHTPHGFEVPSGTTPVVMMNVSVRVPSDVSASATTAVVRSAADANPAPPPRPMRRRRDPPGSERRSVESSSRAR